MTRERFFSLDGPLDLPPEGGQCRAANFAGLADVARTVRPRSRAASSSATAWSRASSPIRKAWSRRSRSPTSLEYCSTMFDDPLFGLHLSTTQDPEVFGCVTALCRSAPTVRAGIRCLIDYLPVVHAPDCEVVLIEGRETAELTLAGKCTNSASTTRPIIRRRCST